MDDGKGVIVVELDKCPITYRRKVYARLSGVNETACRFSENFAGFISYEVAVPVDSGHARHGAVWSQRLRSFVFKPLIKSESYKFHNKLIPGLTRRFFGASQSNRKLDPFYSQMFFWSEPINYKMMDFYSTKSPLVVRFSTIRIFRALRPTKGSFNNRLKLFE